MDETFAEVYSEGRPPNDETVEEIIRKLEAYSNYISLSDRTHREYSYLLLMEYKKYAKEQADKDQK